VKEYADPIINKLDPNNKLIQGRFYRDSCTLKDSFLVKDLLKVSTDMSKTVIVDNIADNFVLQPDNGIDIKTWVK
jgi:TFIIF-interacting CTD phosphatase-like protein